MDMINQLVSNEQDQGQYTQEMSDSPIGQPILDPQNIPNPSSNSGSKNTKPSPYDSSHVF